MRKLPTGLYFYTENFLTNILSCADNSISSTHGYSQGLSGTTIPESARIIALTDVLDALSMRRPYKEAWPLDKTLETNRQETGLHFDPAIAACFFDILQVKNEWAEKEAVLEQAK